MNQRLKRLRLPMFVVLLVALFAIGMGTLQAQTINTTERIAFEPGENTTSIDSEIGGTLVNHYFLYAGVGQELTVTVTSPGNNVYLSVFTPSGVPLVRAQTGAKSYQGILTETGDYNLRVSTTPGGPWTDYTLDVGVSGTPLPTPLPSPTPLPTSTPLPPPPGATLRINFAPGATNATRTGRIDGNEIDTWIVNARAGQFMQTWVTTPNNDLFLTVVSPSGSPLARAQAGAKSFSGTLPENGDYRLSVSSPSGTAHSNYSLFVSITGSTSGGGGTGTTQRITFAAGATSATVTGRIDLTEIDNFLLNARAGQLMQVTVSSPANDVYLTVVSPSGSPLARAQAGAQSFNGTLPENGDYRLSVSSPSGTARSNYTLFVSVTGSGTTPPTAPPPSNTVQRITFAPGTTSASVAGTVDGGTTRTYLVGAQAGQRMQIAIASSAGNVYLTVTTPSGATMISAEFGETSLDRFLPENGDYRITASTLPGTATTSFTLYVSII